MCLQPATQTRLGATLSKNVESAETTAGWELIQKLCVFEAELLPPAAAQNKNAARCFCSRRLWDVSLACGGCLRVEAGLKETKHSKRLLAFFNFFIFFCRRFRLNRRKTLLIWCLVTSCFTLKVLCGACVSTSPAPSLTLLRHRRREVLF